MKNEGGVKSVFWLKHPSKIIVIGENFVKIIQFYWEWMDINNIKKNI